MPLHIEARPKSLKSFYGNSSLKISLLMSIGKSIEKRNHAFLFTGASGCGKTTLARIMARKFGCKKRSIVEINASDFTGVDAMRSIIRDLSFMPIGSKAKAYIIDECHMLSNSSQNALLKDLEEPPNHVYFFLCSTDPQKILKTIKNRCAIYELNRLRGPDLTDLINDTIKKYNLNIKKEVKSLIIENCEGVPRTALIMLEKVDGIKKTQEALDIIMEQTGIEYNVIELCRKLLDDSCSLNQLLNIYKGIKSPEPERIRRAILGYMKSVVLNSKQENKTKKAIEIGSCFIEDVFASGEFGLLNMLYEASK